jgi:hypothetical protein
VISLEITRYLFRGKQVATAAARPPIDQSRDHAAQLGRATGDCAARCAPIVVGEPGGERHL